MSDNDEEELRQALDKYTNAIRAERRAVDQGDSAEVDQGDSTMSDHGDRELLGARDLEALTGTKATRPRIYGYFTAVRHCCGNRNPRGSRPEQALRHARKAEVTARAEQ
jgi:hypothetical protein